MLFFRGQLGYNIGPADVLKRAEDAGAAAIFGSDFRGGNYNTQSYKANTKVPTFNVGSQDALMLRDLIAKAAAGNSVRVTIRLDAKWESGQESFLVWETLPGTTDETIYVVAHRDGWFDAAGDNASGVASMLGLAEHYAKVPQAQRRRTMVFIGPDGHHQIRPGWYGAAWLVANREKFFSKTALMLNAEHPSRYSLTAATRAGPKPSFRISGMQAEASDPNLQGLRSRRSMNSVCRSGRNQARRRPAVTCPRSHGSSRESSCSRTISSTCTVPATRRRTWPGQGWKRQRGPTPGSSTK